MKMTNRIRSNAELQLRMTVYVTGAVLIASAVILAILAFIFRNKYGEELDGRLTDALDATSQVIEQRMVQMDRATGTMAVLAAPHLGSVQSIDSLLSGSLRGMDDIQAVGLVLRRGYFAGIPDNYQRMAYYDEDGVMQLESFDVGKETDRNSIWVRCFEQGDSGWTEPAEAGDGEGFESIGYYAPLYGPDGQRAGIVFSAVLERYITSFVTEYKTRKDVDISIYSKDGIMVVAPDDYISNIAPGDLIVREKHIDQLGWTVRLCADRAIIDRRVNSALLTLALLILLMFFIISLAIMVTVRRVAEPFVERQQQIEKAKAVMDNEMQLASHAQKGLVPHTFPPFPERGDIDLHAFLQPARVVGGDLYDYFIQDGKLYFCIGDVSGKGVPASLFMAATRYLFRSVADSLPACEAVQQMNRSLCADNDQCMFVTFWFGCYDPATGGLEYVNAGHNEPVIVRGGKAEYMPKSENMPLGVMEDVEFVKGGVSLSAGDILLLYTDGVTEAMDSEGHQFGTDRLLETAGCLQESASALIDSVLDAVHRHSSGALQSDDITMLCLRICEGVERKG